MAQCARNGCRSWRPAVIARVAGLGYYLDDRWYCSVGCLEAAARARLATPQGVEAVPRPSVPPLRLGVLLTQQSLVQPEGLKKALAQQAKTGLRLGALLVRSRAVSSADLLRGLAAQAGVPFLTTVDRGRLASAPAGLARDAVRAMGLVPFEWKEAAEVIKVACTAPLPRTALHAMRQLTGCRIDPYLVADEMFPGLLEAYGAGRDDTAVCAVGDLGGTASRIAAAARTAGALRMTEARCDEQVWVRVEAPGRTEQLWLRSAAF